MKSKFEIMEIVSEDEYKNVIDNSNSDQLIVVMFYLTQNIVN